MPDPLGDKYPSLSPYNYCANNPLRFIDPDGMDWYDFGDDEQPDIQWRDSSDPQLKPGLWNKIKNMFGKGEYTESLGANVIVAQGLESGEAANKALFTLYSEKNTEGPTAFAVGNTLPSDDKKYATIAPGLYSVSRVIYKNRPALVVNNREAVPTISPNPNPESNYHGQMFADGIYVHIGNKGVRRYSMFTLEGYAISKGCPTLFHGEPKAYHSFMRHFSEGWSGNLYLIRY